jgi:hypothetical protein
LVARNLLQEKGGLSPTISFGGMLTREANVSISYDTPLLTDCQPRSVMAL